MNFRTIICAAVLALSVASFAQTDGPASTQSATDGSAAGSLHLLSRADVQADLRLTAAQKSRIDAIRQHEGQLIANAAGKGGNPQQARSQMNQLISEDNQKAEAQLGDDQKKRLQEIKLQLRGNVAVLDPNVQQKLDITEQQKAQIDTLRQQQTAQIREHMKNGDFGRMKMATIMKRLQEQLGASLIRMLTPDQSAKFKEMKGKPFQIQSTGGAS